MEDILAGFEPVSAANWKAQLAKDLKGITFEQLSRTDANGIHIEPFYTLEDYVDQTGAAVFEHTDWSIMERIVVSDESLANKEALQALSSGASGLIFEAEKTGINWVALLEGIEIAYIHTFFNLKGQDATDIARLKEYIQAKGALTATLGHDVLAAYVQGTAGRAALAHEVECIATQTQQIVVDGSVYYNAGANSTYQLGLITAQVNEYVQALSDRNALDQLKQVQVTIATGTAFFEEIAKVRALRQLLTLLLEQYQVQPEIQILACTGTLYKAPFDAYTNLLRDTLAGMAAVVGGCNALYILPFDEGHSKGKEAFSKRMSINTQLLFKEESYLHHIADAAKGSYYLENLTAQIGDKAWEAFKGIEAKGGFIEAFEQGILSAAIQAQADTLLEQYRSGDQAWIGMNKYPNPVDMPQQVSKTVYADGLIGPLNIAAVL